MIISKTHALKSFFICLMMTLLFTNVNAQDPIKIMLYGDSLMAGYGLPQKDNLASELSREIKSNDSTISFINASISGNTSKNGLSRLTGRLEIIQTLLFYVSVQMTCSEDLTHH